jgi:tyrosinase
VVPNSWLTLDSPLDPFKKENGETYTSRDCVNIETQLGYTYGPGSLEEVVSSVPDAVTLGNSRRVVHVSGVNRAPIRGSFLVSAFARIDGQKHHLGTEAVLSRWSVQGCANCQTHLEVKAVFPLHGLGEHLVSSAAFEVEIRTRDGLLEAASLEGGRGPQRRFRLEVR